MKKRGLSELIAIVLLILIVIIVVSIVLTFVLRGIGEKEDIIRVQNELSKESLDIDRVKFDSNDLSKLTVTLKNGPGAQIFLNISQEDRFYDVNVTVTRFNVTEVNYSRIDIVTGVNVTYVNNSKIVSVPNTTIISVPNTTIVYVLNSTIEYVSNSTIVNGSQSDIVVISDVSGSMSGTKLTESKKATKDFIDSVFNQTENKLGIVAYDRTVRSDWSYPISDSNSILSLKATVDKWNNPYTTTCVCCGINEATNQLKNLGRNRVVVLMSDGIANVACSEQGTNRGAKQAAIEAARTAYENNGITVNTVAYGSNSDKLTMQAIASAGNGSYYFADVNNLSEVYSAISGNITWMEAINKTWQEEINITLGQVEVNVTLGQVDVNITFGQVEVNITWQDEVNITWQENVTETIYETNITEYNETVNIRKYNSSNVYSYLKVLFYTEDKTYQKTMYSSDLPPPHETREINLTVDSSWGITTDDLTKIEIYPVVILEGEKEIVGSAPIAVWKKPSEY